MPERPPPGYNTRDKPLPHLFKYDYTLNIFNDTNNSTILTYMRSSKATNDPSTIEVNPRNAAFAVDTGALICEDSIVQTISIRKNFAITEAARVTENIRAIKMNTMKIMGVFEDSWTPKDEKTNLEVEDILEVTRDATNMDVTPKFTTTNLQYSDDHPVSTVTKTEVFGDLNLTTDLSMEGVAFDTDTYFNKKYYTNGGKVTSIAPSMKTFTLAMPRAYHTTFERKFLPKHMRFGRRDLYFGELIHSPTYTSSEQLTDSFVVIANVSQIYGSAIISFNEWNTEFDQKR